MFGWMHNLMKILSRLWDVSSSIHMWFIINCVIGLECTWMNFVFWINFIFMNLLFQDSGKYKTCPYNSTMNHAFQNCFKNLLIHLKFLWIIFLHLIIIMYLFYNFCLRKNKVLSWGGLISVKLLIFFIALIDLFCK